MFENGTLILRHPSNRNETIADIIGMLTGHLLRRKEVSSHVQYLKGFFGGGSSSLCEGSSMTSTILSFAHLQTFSLHDAMCKTLKDDSHYLGDDIVVLKLLATTLSPAYLSLIHHIRMSYGKAGFEAILAFFRDYGDNFAIKSIRIRGPALWAIGTRDQDYDEGMKDIADFRVAISDKYRMIRVEVV